MIKIEQLIIGMALVLFSCQDGVLPRETIPGNDDGEIGCQIEYIEASLSGYVNENLSVTNASSNMFTSYSSPTGVYVQGIQNGIDIKISINYYEGAGEFPISYFNKVTILITNPDGKVSTFKAEAGSISIEEYDSPENGTCIKGTFSVDTKSINSDQVITIINGLFEAVVS